MEQESREQALERRVRELESEVERLKQRPPFFDTDRATVQVPDAMRSLFAEAESTVASYFADAIADPSQANISINDERYVLVRASSLSYEFLNTIRNLYADLGDEQAFDVGRNFLFDISHVIGIEDARRFHTKMNVQDPIARLSAGPVLFAYSGWAQVRIDPDSRAAPDESFFLKYSHPYSFEADAWVRAGQESSQPVCIMNSGYSSGWCEESFGFPLTAVELTCRAQGDDECSFVMAPPHRIEEMVDEVLAAQTESRSRPYRIPTFFERREVERETRQARERAEESDRLKSEFLANMSHEIRTPMHVIIGMTELLLDSPTSDTQRDYLQLVANSAESLLNIINQILDFSKIESGKLQLQPVDVDLCEELSEALRALGPQAYGKGLDLSWSVAPTVPRRVFLDPVRLRQMVLNLVANAIKFTNDGFVKVDVQAVEQGQNQITLHIEIIDSGIGISEDKLASIFSAFQQADASTTRSFGGTGLGLSITSQLAQAMGGRVWVESEPGIGSHFHLLVQAGIAKEIKQEPSRRLENANIVLLEQCASTARLIESIVADQAGSVVWATTFEQAMDHLIEWRMAQDSPPLLLLSSRFDGATGFDLVARLRVHPKLGSVPIVMLLPGVEAKESQRCETLKIKASLRLPIKPSDLVNCLEQAINERLLRNRRPTSHASFSVPSLNILVAEDGKANQRMAQALLTKWGHRVQIASDGHEAVEAWRKGNFDVVLMDVQMPELDGLEATKRIRELENGSGLVTPIIAMTARAMPEDRELCLAAGMDDYISKPVRKIELETALASIIQVDHSRTPEVDEQQSGHPPCPSALLAQEVDWSELIETTAGDLSLLNDILSTSLAELSLVTQRWREAIETCDVDSQRDAAIRLRGIAVSISANHLQDELDGLPDGNSIAELGAGDHDKQDGLVQSVLEKIARLERGIADFGSRIAGDDDKLFGE